MKPDWRLRPMFRSVRGEGDLVSALQLTNMVRGKDVLPDDLFDVCIAGRYCVRAASVVETAGKPAEPFWARHHVGQNSLKTLLPAVAPPRAVAVEKHRFTVPPVPVLATALRKAPDTTPTPVFWRDHPEPPRAPSQVMSQAPATATAQTCNRESPVAKHYRSPPASSLPRTRGYADAPIDFSALWQWKRLRQSPAAQHRTLAAAWARGVLDSHQDWLLVDTETTGLSRHDQVIELAVAKPVRHLGRWRLEPLLVQRMRPSVPVSRSAARVHGITDSDLRHSPTFRDMADQIRSLMHGRRLLAWNAPFDRAAIRRTVTSWQTSAVAEDHDWCCAMRAHAVWAGQSDGRMLYRYHKLGGDHSAMGDVQCMLDRLVSMAESEA